MMKIPISLPCRVAPTTGVINCGRILAADGFECSVYSVNEGCYIPTKRPYGFLSTVCDCGDMIAIGGECTNRVYVLTENLTETDGFTPKINAGPLLTAYPCNGGNALLLTYRKVVVIANCNGEVLGVTKTAPDEVDFMSCYPLCKGCLCAYNDGNNEIIEYSACGNTRRCILPNCVRIKSFVSFEEGVVYGFFTKGYPYAFLAPIWQNGLLCHADLI